jgi:transposase
MMATAPPIPDELWTQLPPAAQAAVLAVIATLEARIAELEARINQNSSNSSKPPSSDPPHAKPAPPRPTTGRRKGGQPGHPRHTRPTLPPDEVLELRADTCRHCRTALCGDDPHPLTHQVIEIPPVRPLVTEYRRHRLTCPRCRRVTRVPLPAGARCGYGVRLQATCALLSGAYRIGKRGIARLCADLFGVPISPATVCKLQHRTTDALAPVAAELRGQLPGRAANVDETGWFQHGKRRWLWAAVTRTASVFVVGKSRSRVALSELVGAASGVLTTDRYPVYDHLTGGARQVCWAHLRRDFQAMIDRADAGSEIGEGLLGCADRLLVNWKRVRDGTLFRGEFNRFHLLAVQRRMEELLWRGRTCAAEKTRHVCMELDRVYESLWTFATTGGVEPTNNAVERALRAGVCWRKTSYGTDSDQGSQFVGRILSVVESCRQHGRNLLAFLTQTIHAVRNNSAPPALIPDTP